MDPDCDGYLRLRPGSTAPYAFAQHATRGDALTFVDVDNQYHQSIDAASILRAFQELPRRLAGTRVLLLRWPFFSKDDGQTRESVKPWLEEIAAGTDAVGMGQEATGGMVFSTERPPKIVWANDIQPSVDEYSLTRRARAAELLALLERGRGIWKPDTYHYRLPSGAHDTAFVRVADAFRDPRDIEVLAYWLSHRLADQRGFLLDTGTVAPIVVRLQALMVQEGLQPGPVATLDEYPHTRLEVRRAAWAATRGDGSAVGLLSVSSSGSVQEKILNGLQDAAPRGEWSLDTLVDKRGERPPPFPELDTWLPRPFLGLSEADAGRCEACADNRRARLVQVDPRSFGAMAFADPDLLVPEWRTALDNAQWWGLVGRAAATGVECQPHSDATPARPKEQLLPIRVLVRKAIEHPDSAAELQDRLNKLKRGEGDAPKWLPNTVKDMSGADTFLVTSNDARLISSHLETFRKGLGAPDAELVTVTGTGPQGAIGQKIVVITAGLVTGWTLSQLRMVATGRGHHEVHGLVVHARPQHEREWQSLRNIFGWRLAALWLTYLPWRSPLFEEARLLEEWQSVEARDQDPDVGAFVEDRIAFCRPPSEVQDWETRESEGGKDEHCLTYAELSGVSEGQKRPPPPYGLLWGQPPRGSGRGTWRDVPLFGRDLDSLTAYAAIGSSVHHARVSRRVRGAPQWLMFEIPAICRSYFDAPLLAMIMRWIEPREAWWGARPYDAERCMSELLLRYKLHREDLVILLPELLLAAAQGKVHQAGYSQLERSLDGLIEDWGPNERIPVDAGRRLAAYALGDTK